MGPSARKRATTVVVLGVGIVLMAACGSAAVRPSSSTARRSSVTTEGCSPPWTSTTTSAPLQPTTTTTAPTQQATTLLGPGDSGPAVLALQRRLSALGYWLGTPDGTFGDSTEQAAYALQKAAGISRDGIVGPDTSVALAQGVVPHPRSTSGYVVEVDLADDLLMIVDNGRLTAVLNTSTGGGYSYVEDGTRAIGTTPVGIFHVYRQVDGLVTDPLGQLWRPKFFDSGFAIHGDSSVPAHPVSHGCVRVSNEAINWIWADNVIPLGTEVWVYG